METYLSRIEAILNGEDIKPLSRVEELLKDYGGDGYDWHETGVHPLYIGASDSGFYRWLVSDVKIYAN